MRRPFRRPALRAALGTCLLLAAAAAGAAAPMAAPSLPAAPAESQAAFDARMAWWRQARFGIFVHWGLYSVAAGEWDGRPVKGSAEWLQRNARLRSDDYARRTRPGFRPTADFATEWARLAREAGARYLVFTTKHHDGFALHDSAVSDFDAKDATGRDLVREVVTAARAQDLRVGFYHSMIDWHHPAYPYRQFARLPQPLPHPLQDAPESADPDYARRANLTAYQDFLQAQVRELSTNYGAVDVLWWDYSNPGAEGETWRAQELMAMVRRAQPGIVMNNRLYRSLGYDDPQGSLRWFDRRHGDFTTPEQAVPAQGVAGVDWETCMTMNGTWGYSAHDSDWKSSTELIRHLVDTASKGGNFLLNIGPDASGHVPQASVTRLRDIGAWLRRNGDAIYGTQASPLAAVDWGRITAKDQRLYLHVFARPVDGRLRLPLRSARRAYLLDGDAALTIERDGDGIAITLPERLADPVATVVVLERGAADTRSAR